VDSQVSRATRHPGLHDAHGGELPGRLLDVDGCETYVVEAGEGPTVVLLHGWGDTADCWRRVVPWLVKAHHVVAFDIPPLGRSAVPRTDGETLIDFYGRFFPELLRMLEIERASLVGHSLGGAIALHLALEQPETVERLALVAPAGLGTSAPWWWHLLAGTRLRWTELLRIPTPITRPAVRFGVRTFLHQRLFHDPRRLQEAVHHLVDLHGGRRELDALLATGRALMHGYSGTLLDQAARQLEVPVMVVWGVHDGLVPVEHARAFGAAVRHAEVHVLERCGHYPQIELPTLFNELLAAFLEETTADQSGSRWSRATLARTSSSVSSRSPRLRR
jgi:pimeloyl-ACP methyl ester carboxylesterase